MKYLLLFTTLIFAAELEVDGDLKVTGTVDANGNPITNVGAALSMTDAINGNVLQSALRDDAIYTIKYYSVKFNEAFSGEDTFHSEYKEIGQSEFNGGWENHLNSLLQEGWIISRAFQRETISTSHINILYELKKAND